MKGQSLQKNRQYEVSFEIAGPYATWTDPAFGDAPSSYSAPTYSAAKGIFESILFVPWADVIPIKVEICRPLRYLNFTFNYAGPLRKAQQINDDTAYQAKWTVLQDVCYRIYGVPVGCREYYKKDHFATTNGAHAYQERFTRLLERGQYRLTPHLGCKEFDAWYFGPLREGTSPCAEVDMVIPSFFHRMFQTRFQKVPQPEFRQSVRIDGGVLHYVE
jgi:CRISPR-associated protein Cas5d